MLAGPGTGKTSYGLMRRGARLLEEGVPPAEILLVSFTRPAAHDLRTKVANLGVEGAEEVQATTLHAEGDDLTIKHTDGEHQLTGIAPMGRAEALANLLRSDGARHARQHELQPRSPAERQAALKAAIFVEVQKGYHLAYEGQFEAVLHSSAA